MTIHLGDVPASSTLYIPWATYDANGASVTMSGLATSDILIYKNGSTTQRSSTAGFTLLDTDGTDFDGVTGLHGISIDLSDNTDAGFYAAGAFYWVVISTVTVSTQTVTLIAATFRIRAADNTAGVQVVDVSRINNVSASSVTTINANVGTTQPINFTGTGASALAKSDMVDVAGAAVSTSTAQIGVNVVNFGGSSGTFASGRPEVNTSHIAGSAVSTSAAQIGVNVVNAGGTAWASGSLTSGVFAAGAINAAAIAADAIGASELAADAASEVAAAVWDLTRTGHSTSGTFGEGVASVQGNVTGSVASVSGNVGGNVTGSVGSVTGNVGGNVTGSVGSVATGGITAASIAADAIGASELAADAVTEIAAGVLTTALTESYAADGVAPTLTQALFLIQQMLTERSVASTTVTVKKLDGTTNAATFALNDATTPTSITRAT